MAMYAYKFVRDQLPPYLTTDKEGYEGDANYDGDQWDAAAEYIAALEAEVSKQIAGSHVVFDRQLCDWLKTRQKTLYVDGPAILDALEG